MSVYGALKEDVDGVRTGCDKWCLGVKKTLNDVREGVRNSVGGCAGECKDVNKGVDDVGEG